MATLPQSLDWRVVFEALGRLAPAFQAPIALFSLEDYSYHEIAEIPLGTVNARAARGLAQLQRAVVQRLTAPPRLDRNQP